MAKKESNLVKVKTLVNLKYDKKCVSIDDEFEVRLEDASAMVEKGYIELLEELPQEEETPKEGE